MNLKCLYKLWKCDFNRYKRSSNKLIAKLRLFFFTPGFKYTFFMRLCKYLSSGKKKFILLPFNLIARIWLKHYEYKFGIQIPYHTNIDEGFYIGHFGCIVVHGSAKIGKNCNISQGVTIGITRTGVPIIGDEVYLGAGAKVIGGIKIGNNVAVGANCVVTKDIPDNAVVVGVPGKIISYKGNIREMRTADNC